MKSVLRPLLRHASTLLFLLALCLLGVNARAGTYTVTSLADSGPDTLRTAIVSANSDPGSTINFQPGLSGTILLLSAEPNITANMTIQGPGPNVIAVDGASKYTVLTVPSNSTVTITGLTIQHGAYTGSGITSAGGLFMGYGANSGTCVTVSNCVFSGSISGFGGAICNDGGTLAVTNCTITGNTGNYCGGINNQGVATITGCTINGNITHQGAGAIMQGYYRGGTITTVMNCTINGNSGAMGGNAILNKDGTLTVVNCAFTNNLNSGATNGGDCIFNNHGTLTLTGSTFCNNGTAVDNYTYNPSTMTNNIFYSNTVEINDSNMGVYPGSATISNCDVQGGYPGAGNFDADPLFVRVPTNGGGSYYGPPLPPDYGDLHLKSGSLCFGVGTSAAPAYSPTDLDGVTRGNPPSIGAYEL